jgi:type II secretory pathway pseudopilin PulG
MKKKQLQLGITLIEVIVVVLIIGIMLTLWSVSVASKKTEVRDLKRLNDMNELKNGLELMKNETGYYDRAFCDLTYVSSCAKNENSELGLFLPGISKINDPRELQKSCAKSDNCQSGVCNYAFTKIDSDDYEVLFHLEKGSDRYGGQGCYKLTPSGINKVN